jgi:hypothetical protein
MERIGTGKRRHINSGTSEEAGSAYTLLEVPWTGFEGRAWHGLAPSVPTALERFTE